MHDFTGGEPSGGPLGATMGRSQAHMDASERERNDTIDKRYCFSSRSHQAVETAPHGLQRTEHDTHAIGRGCARPGRSWCVLVEYAHDTGVLLVR